LTFEERKEGKKEETGKTQWPAMHIIIANILTGAAEYRSVHCPHDLQG